jgi:hypothetical protein
VTADKAGAAIARVITPAIRNSRIFMYPFVKVLKI